LEQHPDWSSGLDFWGVFDIAKEGGV